MEIIEVCKQFGIEECPECHCNLGDDWEYKDFSNKNIVICPQCKYEIYLEKIEISEKAQKHVLKGKTK